MTYISVEGCNCASCEDARKNAAAAQNAIYNEQKIAAKNADRAVDGTKPTNPKDALGIKKTPFSTVPMQVVAEVGLAMMEGACKYGRHNYRAIGVRASVYFDATMRHVTAWWEGEDIDRDSALSHVTKAIASLVVLRDAMLNSNWTDDRPPKVVAGWMPMMNEHTEKLIEKYPNPVPPYTEKTLPER